MRGRRTFSLRMPRISKGGKLNAVELSGVGSAGESWAPARAGDGGGSVGHRAVVCREIRAKRVGTAAGAHARSQFRGTLNNRMCMFTIDTGSDVSLLCPKLAIPFKDRKSVV